MKFFLLRLILFLESLISTTYAQKPAIDSSAYDKWSLAQSGYISNDGKFISYTIDKQPTGGSTSVIRSTDGKWRKESTESGFGISADSRRAIYKISNDSLAILTLGTDSFEIIPHVRSYRFLTKNKDTWLLYYLVDSANELFVRNLGTGQLNSFSLVTDYFFTNESSAIIIKKESERNGKPIQSLDWVDLASRNAVTIWKGPGMNGGVIFDNAYRQAAFLIEDSINSQMQKSIWFYRSGTNKAIRLIDEDSHLQIEGVDHFSEDGTRLFIRYKEKSEEIKTTSAGGVQVDVWSYTDSKLQSQQLYELKNPPFHASHLAVIQIETHQLFPLEKTGETIMETNDHFAIVYHPEGEADPGESSWNPACSNSIFLVSARDGSRKLIQEHTSFIPSLGLSPEGKYLIWYDPKEKNYFSLEIATGITRNITKAISTEWTEYQNDHPDAARAVSAVSGWLKGDVALLLHDQNDIWQVDLSGNVPPANLTNGYGKRHHILFRLARDEGSAVINPDKKILLSAFNRSTKDNGFFSKILSQKADPSLLTMGPYVYEVPGHDDSHNQGINGVAPLRARDAEAYIVRRMSATESPNYFYTTDFKSFTPISAVHPEEKYNWLTSELISWKTLNGSIAQGVLYKAENFDPKKKYPVIFYYYERLSDELNEFKQPEVSFGPLDIPTYVSNGYLVFTPDIHYEMGETGESAVNSIVSAAKWLSKMPWVDSLKMGLQGHSFGGYETNYLITHSHLFAAACSASGLSDLISDYGGLMDNGASMQGMFEDGQSRLGTTLWKRPNLYIKNSPIFKADQVTTPLLMMHTTNDGICPLANAVEFFTALRRLGSKIWMLQYDNYNHLLFGNAAVDFNIRMKQFFDHYLKGAPAPKWMVEGIPASRKGMDNGLELEPPGVKPGPGLLIPEEQKKIDALRHKNPITLTID